MKSRGPPAHPLTSELLCLPCPASSPDPPPGAAHGVTCPLSWGLPGLSAPPLAPGGAPRPHGPGPTGHLPLELKPTRIRSLANSVTCLSSFPSCSLALPHTRRIPQSRYSRPLPTSPYIDHLPYRLRNNILRPTESCQEQRRHSSRIQQPRDPPAAGQALVLSSPCTVTFSDPPAHSRLRAL